MASSTPAADPPAGGVWQEAERLARRQGLHRTARTLRLDYKRLKERFAASNGAPTKFVGLAPPVLMCDALSRNVPAGVTRKLSGVRRRSTLKSYQGSY